MRQAKATPWESFGRDWLLIAPLPVWAAVGVGMLLRINLFAHAVTQGALLSIFLSMAWFYWDDMPLGSWKEGNALFRAAAWLVAHFKYLLLVLATTLFVCVSVREVLVPMLREPPVGGLTGLDKLVSDAVAPIPDYALWGTLCTGAVSVVVALTAVRHLSKEG